MRATGAPPIVLPPEAADLYRSGVPLNTIARRYDCSWEAACRALERVGVQIRRQRPRCAVYRKPVSGRVPCGDCGEDLNHTHPSGLGSHLPGCGYELERT